MAHIRETALKMAIEHCANHGINNGELLLEMAQKFEAYLGSRDKPASVASGMPINAILGAIAGSAAEANTVEQSKDAPKPEAASRLEKMQAEAKEKEK